MATGSFKRLNLADSVTFSFMAIAALPAIAAVASGSLALYAWQRPEISGAKAFSLCSAATFVWCFFSIFEFLSAGEVAKVIFGKAQYLGLAPFPVFWLIFTLRYAQRDGWISHRFVAAISTIPLLSLVFALTDRWHGWVWRSAVLKEMGFPHLEIVHGWWFDYVMVPHSYTLLLSGFGVLLSASFSGSKLYRRQTLVLLVAALIPFSCNVLYVISGITLYGLDLTPVGFAIAGCLIYFGLFRVGFLEIAPISYKTVFINTTDAVILLDGKRRIVDLNPSAVSESRRLTEAKAALGCYLEDIFVDYGNLFTTLFPTGKEQPELTRTLQLPARMPNRHTGQPQVAYREVKVRSLLSPGKRSVGWVVMIRDVTLEKQQHAQLEQFAYVDSLTGLFNRRQLELATQKIFLAQSPIRPPLEASLQLALLYIDLNDFKPINDEYGHDVGDVVLKYFARCLSQSVRQGDMVVRLGGDEFVALLYNADTAIATDIRARLHRSLGRTVVLADHRFRISASIGIAYYPTDATTLSQLIQQADKNMYKEKQSFKKQL
ncbi:MAG: histidine kinase N-terminal 7TM domain-containing protein [Cyanobacteria bacterium J06554_11]